MTSPCFLVCLCAIPHALANPRATAYHATGAMPPRGHSMLGPVLYLEILLGGRGGRQAVFRWVYGAWLVGLLLFYYGLYWVDYRTSAGAQGPDPSATGRFVADFIELFVVQQFILVLLATPAVTAGAITDEKTRGTLQHLLT